MGSNVARHVYDSRRLTLSSCASSMMFSHWFSRSLGYRAPEKLERTVASPDTCGAVTMHFFSQRTCAATNNYDVCSFQCLSRGVHSNRLC